MVDTLRQFNLAMRYIEDNLADEIDFSRVAQVAQCSEYHFRRMFSLLSGMSLSEYIRRRRLSQAAVELCHSDIRVIDLAVKYGYASADAFTRAFSSLHGLTPTEARMDGAALKLAPPITFQLTMYGGAAMDYRIVNKEAFYLVGPKKRIALIYQGVNPEAQAMWQSLTPEDIRELKAMSNVEPYGLLSVSAEFSEGREEGTHLDHLVGVATTQSSSDRWAVMPVAASAWAVFTVRGAFPTALQDTWARIYAEWFPSAGYEACEGPEIVWTESKDRPLSDFHNEIWIPVRRRA